jgi:hypothetical protein
MSQQKLSKFIHTYSTSPFDVKIYRDDPTCLHEYKVYVHERRKRFAKYYKKKSIHYYSVHKVINKVIYKTDVTYL